MKSWSYKEITQKAEHRITEFVAYASKQQDKHLQQVYQDAAYGVYLFWSSLTMDWQDDGDDARLEALTKPDKTAANAK